jgi:hypothetical protein
VPDTEETTWTEPQSEGAAGGPGDEEERELDGGMTPVRMVGARAMERGSEEPRGRCLSVSCLLLLGGGVGSCGGAASGQEVDAGKWGRPRRLGKAVPGAAARSPRLYKWEV